MRKLIPFLLLLALAAPLAHAESYRGEMNAWQTNWMTQDTDFGNIWKVSVTSSAADASSTFKFDQSGNWNPQWGYKAAYATNAVANSTIGSRASTTAVIPPTCPSRQATGGATHFV